MGRSDYLFGSQVTFTEAFPGIEKMSLTVTEVESLIWLKEQNKYHLTVDHPGGEYIECTNPVCQGRGAPIGSMLREAVAKKSETIDTQFSCQGYEDNGRRCLHAFIVKGTIMYKDLW